MFIQYRRYTQIPALMNAGVNYQGLYGSGQWTESGAPTATPDTYMPAAILQNTADGTIYYNSGTTAAPSWTLVGSGGGSVTADNGLELSGSEVQMGGAFIQDTTILGADFNYYIGDLDAGSILNGYTAIAGDTSGYIGALTSGVNALSLPGLGAKMVGIDSTLNDPVLNMVTAGDAGGFAGLNSESSAMLSFDTGANRLSLIEVRPTYIDIRWFGSGDLRINGSAGTSGQVLTSNGSGANPTWETSAAGSNIYSADGTVSGNRTVDADGNNLSFTNIALGIFSGANVAFAASNAFENTGTNSYKLNTSNGAFLNANVGSGTITLGDATANLVFVDSTGSDGDSGQVLTSDGTNATWEDPAVVAVVETYSPSNVSTDRAYDADSTTTEELADVLGTLIADLQTSGIIS